jgi:hypothetical protein
MGEMKKQAYDLEERLFEYSVSIIKIVDQLPNTKGGNHVSGQLLRSGTSPYPNHGEAQAAESPKDFIHNSILILFSFEIGRWMLDVRCSSFIFFDAHLFKPNPRLTLDNGNTLKIEFI